LKIHTDYVKWQSSISSRLQCQFERCWYGTGLKNLHVKTNLQRFFLGTWPGVTSGALIRRRRNSTEGFCQMTVSLLSVCQRELQTTGNKKVISSVTVNRKQVRSTGISTKTFESIKRQSCCIPAITFLQ